MAGSTSRQPSVHIVEPRGRSKITGVEIVEDPNPDDAPMSQEDTADGGIQIIIGGDSTEKPKRETSRFGDNLAEDIDKGTLDAIAGMLLDGIDADLQSRKDWEETANMAADYLGIKLEDPNPEATADGTVCKSIATTMLEATIKLWGTARGELLPVGGPVKVRKDSRPAIGAKAATPPVPGAPPAAPEAPLPLPTGIMAKIIGRIMGGGVANADAPDATDAPGTAPDDIAEALQTDMNHFLTVTDREYYPDFSKMLLNRALIGNAFRKVHRCPLRRRPNSAWVKAQDLIVSNDCSHLMAAGRVTERIRMRQSVMRRLQVKGHYLDIPLVQPTGETDETEDAVADAEGIAAAPQLPEDFEHVVFECYCELGSSAAFSLMGDAELLDKDETGKRIGYPLPYRVSIDKDTRAILEIRRNWKQGDEDHRARQRYVKYGFIPGLGFWDLGLIHILGNTTQTATMIQRSLVDAGLFANFPGGVFLKGVGSRQTNTVIRPNPGQFIGMEATGASKIADVLMALPYKEPSAQSMAMGAKMEGDARRLAGVIELPIGDGRSSNIPVGTILAYIEAVSQVPGAVHKDDHIAQQQEFELLRELFVEEPEALIAGNRRPARKWQLAAELAEPELVPAADPNTQSSVHRLMKLQGMVAVGGLPQFAGIADNRKIYGKVMATLTGEDDKEYMLPEAPPGPAQPPPQVAAAVIRANSQEKSDQTKVGIETMKAETKKAELAADATSAQLDHHADLARSSDNLKGVALKTLADSAHTEADRGQDHAQHQDKMGLEHRKVDSQEKIATLPPPEGPGFSGKGGL